MRLEHSIAQGLALEARPDSSRTWPVFGSRSFRRARSWFFADGTHILFLFLLVFLAYRPLLPGNFLMDDRRLIEGSNPIVQGTLTARSVWFQADFPLTTVAFWAEWKLWGTNPAGYHLVNLFLHGLSAVLIWRLARYLKIPGAWLAGAIFALHPVAVVSVARIAELKNTLSLPFFLLCLLAFLHFDDAYQKKPELLPHLSIDRSRTFWFALALISFVLGLLAKTSGVMLPFIFLLVAAWRRGRIRGGDWLQASPFFVISLGFGILTMWFQKFQALAGEAGTPQNFWNRLAAGCQNFWFYFQKALWPFQLNVVYGHSHTEAAVTALVVPMLFFVILIGAGVVFRRSWGRHLLFALACFAVALFPVLGFFDAQFLSTLSISDHLQYLPMVALVMAIAAGVGAACSGKMFRGLSIGLLLGLGWLTFQRTGVFATEEGLWRDTLAKNSGASGAHNDLGCLLAEQGKLAEAEEHFAAALRGGADNANAQSNLGQIFAGQGKTEKAEELFRKALKNRPDHAETHKRYAALLAETGRDREAILHLRCAIGHRADIENRIEMARLHYKGENYAEAVAQLRKVLSFQADHPDACNSLAWLLATCPEPKIRNGREALNLAFMACRITQFKQAQSLGTFAAAYAEAGLFSRAIAKGEQAVRVALAAGDTQAANLNRQLLLLYRRNEPFHESRRPLQQAMASAPDSALQ